MNQSIQALSLSQKASRWLEETKEARVLHIFEPVCNLVNENNEALSIVIPEIGNGPFSMVVEKINFGKFVSKETNININHGILQMGKLTLSPNGNDLWTAQPDWNAVKQVKIELSVIKNILKRHAPQDSIARLALDLPSSMPEKVIAASKQGLDLIHQGIAQNALKSIQDGAKRLAGLGVGLTPAGDDYLVGVMHGVWARMKNADARKICQAIIDSSVDRTTTLSKAWLQAAAGGEAGEVWHALLDALIKESNDNIAYCVMRILPTGHTSGADALAGFVDTVELLQ